MLTAVLVIMFVTSSFIGCAIGVFILLRFAVFGRPSDDKPKKEEKPEDIGGTSNAACLDLINTITRQQETHQNAIKLSSMDNIKVPSRDIVIPPKDPFDDAIVPDGFPPIPIFISKRLMDGILDAPQEYIDKLCKIPSFRNVALVPVVDAEFYAFQMSVIAFTVEHVRRNEYEPRIDFIGYQFSEKCYDIKPIIMYLPYDRVYHWNFSSKICLYSDTSDWVEHTELPIIGMDVYFTLRDRDRKNEIPYLTTADDVIQYFDLPRVLRWDDLYRIFGET